MARPSESVLEDLVAVVINTDDPTLYRRACSALGALLAEPDDEADFSLPFERH